MEEWAGQCVCVRCVCAVCVCDVCVCEQSVINVIKYKWIECCIAVCFKFP